MSRRVVGEVRIYLTRTIDDEQDDAAIDLEEAEVANLLEQVPEGIPVHVHDALGSLLYSPRDDIEDEGDDPEERDGLPDGMPSSDLDR